MVHKPRRPPRPSGGGPGWSQSKGGPLAHAAGAPVVSKRGRPLCPAAGASVIPKRRRPARPCGGGPGGVSSYPHVVSPSPKRRGQGGLGGLCIPAYPRGASLSPRGPGRTEGTRVSPPLGWGGWHGVSSKPPQGVPIPPRPTQARRDAGVSAAVWGWVVRRLLETSTGRPYPSHPQQNMHVTIVSASP